MKILGCLTSTTDHLKHSVWLLVLVMWSVPVEASDRPCAYDEQVHGYVGPPVEQARCLMRPVQKWGRVSDSRPSLPPPLESLIGTTVTLSAEQFRTYIASLGI